jgi:adenylate cyclase
MSADVVGYSRLMGSDEVGTLSALKELRATLIDPLIAEHCGRIVKLMGDGALVEFGSAVDAVECAVRIQRLMAERNLDTPGGSSIAFRIGVNVGDVIIDGEDLYGDGVNVAARLEKLADPGGICISGMVFDQVKDRSGAATRGCRWENIGTSSRNPAAATALRHRRPTGSSRCHFRLARQFSQKRRAHPARS